MNSLLGIAAMPSSPTRAAEPAVHRPFTLARFAIDSPVLPLIQQTLPLAEQVRFALMSVYEKVKLREKYGRNIPDNHERFSSPVFSGKDEAGRPLQGHRHAFFLPTDEDGDGRIDHVTVYLRSCSSLAPPSGTTFDPSEVKALDRLRRLRFGGRELQLLLVGLDSVEDVSCSSLAPRPSPLVLFGPSRSWISATPFVATRYPKKRGRKRDAPELLGRDNREAFVAAVLGEQLERLRQLRPDLPMPDDVEPLPDRRIPPQNLLPIQFQRSRRKRGDDGRRRPSGAFRITFPEPVAGPICLGHSSHFGLGLFVPDTFSKD